MSLSLKLPIALGKRELGLVTSEASRASTLHDDPRRHFPLIYQDDCLIAVNKPSGILTHAGMEAHDDELDMVKCLSARVGEKVYPVHRLDRATSGLMLFARSVEAARKLSDQFAKRQTIKTYLALVRGWPMEKGSIDYPLRKLDPGSTHYQDAKTEYTCIAKTQLELPNHNLKTSRYSLVVAKPLTGRQHQIRRHLKHIHHPIIGDTCYGKGDHNRFFRSEWDINRLLLHSFSLSFVHPFQDEMMTLEASLDASFLKLIKEFSWEQILEEFNSLKMP